MSKNSEENPSESFLPDDLKLILRSLSEQEKVLIACNYQLYDGRWDMMKRDLEQRLEGKPYVFKLGSRIKEDLQCVERLRDVETKFSVRLSDYVTI
jgi:hypothetical protein